LLKLVLCFTFKIKREAEAKLLFKNKLALDLHNEKIASNIEAKKTLMGLEENMIQMKNKNKVDNMNASNYMIKLF
jgi:hypothetical protein